MNELFPVESVLQDSPKLAWMKANHVLTHNAPHMEQSWCAIVARPEHRGMDIGEIMAKACQLYDLTDRIGYGETEDEAIADLAIKHGMRLWNEGGE